MQLSKKSFVTFLWFATITFSTALEGEEVACPAFEGTTGNPTCEECVSNNCGFAIDHGDCVQDCATVTDTECFSTATSTDTTMDAASICAMAAEASSSTGSPGATTTTEEVMCASQKSGEAYTCESCLGAGCAWTADDGDCLQSCDTVNDGAECIAMGDAPDAATACGSAPEVMCPGLDGKPSCETCLEAGCGWTADDSDCLESCDSVNDGADCISLAEGGVVAEFCPAPAQEEAMCPTFVSESEIPSCQACLDAGCGWTADDGDCLESCDAVNDGAECISSGSGQCPTSPEVEDSEASAAASMVSVLLLAIPSAGALLLVV